MSSTKELAHGRWPDILSAYIPSEFLRKKHGQCPLCGGKDRFRFDDKSGNGEYFCSKCGAGSGVHLLAQHQDCTHSEAWKLVEKVVGSAIIAPRKTQVDQVERVKKIFSTCSNGTPGDFVDQYFASRMLQNAPESLLRGRWWLGDAEMPAMVARCAKGSKIVGLHLTFIEGGKKRDRRMYAVADGALVGSAVRLHKLNGGDAIVIGEGIETSLSGGVITGLPVWAALDAGKLEKVDIPEQIRRVVILADNDASYTGQAAAFALAKRLKSAGKSVEVLMPEIEGEDWNDVICKK